MAKGTAFVNKKKSSILSDIFAVIFVFGVCKVHICECNAEKNPNINLMFRKICKSFFFLFGAVQSTLLSNKTFSTLHS